MVRKANRTAEINTNSADQNTFHESALQLADNELPPGWKLVCCSRFARVAHNEEQNVFYKEFLPRSPIEPLKALIKGSRAARARKHNDLLVRFGFNAPTNLAWGGLPGGREYLFASAVPGKGVNEWIRTILTQKTREGLALRRQFLRELGTFIGQLHASGFIHGDLRTGNILGERCADRFEFSLIDNERNMQQIPASGKLLLKNLMQLNMHSSLELNRTDRMRFFGAWHSLMKDLSPLEAKLIATSAYQWAVSRLEAKGKQ